MEKERGLTFIHPFDDELIGAGAGTVGLELLEQVNDLDVVVVGVGGGGLISGMLPAIKEQNPKIRVYGVEPVGANAMAWAVANTCWLMSCSVPSSRVAGVEVGEWYSNWWPRKA